MIMMRTRKLTLLAACVSLSACPEGKRRTEVELSGLDEATRYGAAAGGGLAGDGPESAPFAELDPIPPVHLVGTSLVVGFSVEDADGIAELNLSLMRDLQEVGARIDLAPTATSATVALDVPPAVGYFVRLRVADRAGRHTIVDSNDFEVVVDSVPPPAPAVTWLTPSPTALGLLEFSVTNCEPDTTVQLASEGTTADPNGVWTECTALVTQAALGADGTFAFIVYARDEDGNISEPSAAYQITVDTTPPPTPTVLVTPAEALIKTAALSVTVSACEAQSEVAWTLDGAEPSQWTACASGPFSVMLPSEGSHTLRVYARDALGHVSPAHTHAVTLDTTPPILIPLWPDAFIASGAQVTLEYLSADLNAGPSPVLAEYSLNGIQFFTIGSGTSLGPIAWDTSGVSGLNVTLRLTASDLAGNSASVTTTSVFDAAAPVVSELRLNGDATISALPIIGESFVGLSWRTTDDASGISQLCIKRSQGPVPAVPPLGSDACWLPIATFGGTAGALSVTVPVVPYAVKMLARLPFRIFVWAKDRAGRISTNSATLGTDTVRGAYDPGPPPLVTNVFVMTSDDATWPLEPSGSPSAPVFVKWKAIFPNNTDPSQGRIDLQYSADDVTWKTFATGLSNSPGDDCTLDNPDPNGADPEANFTGCYLWTETEKPDGYYGVRVVATDRKLLSTVVSATPPMNAGPVRFLVGNPDSGFGGSSLSTFFDAIETGQGARNNIFAITERGVLYYVDKNAGLVWVNPNTANSELLLRTDPTLDPSADIGDGDDVRLAVARDIGSITVDHDGRIYVSSTGRVRRIDVDESGIPSSIDTLLGGGAEAMLSGSAIDPATIDYDCLRCPMFALRNGVVWAFHRPDKRGDEGFRLLRYTPATESEPARVAAIVPSGFGLSPDAGSLSDAAAAPIDKCHMVPMAAERDPSGSTVDAFILRSIAYAWEAGDGCYQDSGAVNFGYGFVRVGEDGVALPPWEGRPGSGYHGGAGLMYGGLDGKVYWYSMLGESRLYVRVPGGWDPALGPAASYDGTNCPDGIDRLSCSLATRAMFTSEGGGIFWFAAGRLRSLDLAGKAITIAGQGAYFGDGTPSLAARVSTLYHFDRWDEGSEDKLTFFDVGNQRVREATIDGAIIDLTGDGTPRDSGIAAPTAALGSPFQCDSRSALAVDPAPPHHVYLESLDSAKLGVVRINRTSGEFERVVGCEGMGCTPYFEADGVAGTSVALRDPDDEDDGGAGRSHIMGLRGGQLLVAHNRAYDDGVTGYLGSDAFMKYYNLSDFVQSNFAGKTGFDNDPFVYDSQPRSDHFIGMGNGHWVERADSVYDAGGQRWLHAARFYIFDARIIGLPDAIDDPLEPLDKTVMPAAELVLPPRSSFAFRRAGSEYIYYCYDYSGWVPDDPKNHRLFVKKISDGAVPDAELPWPIPSLKCRGTKLVWDEARNSLIFAYSKGSLYGIAEYFNPPTP